jgi:hypothetical protein
LNAFTVVVVVCVSNGRVINKSVGMGIGCGSGGQRRGNRLSSPSTNVRRDVNTKTSTISNGLYDTNGTS